MSKISTANYGAAFTPTISTSNVDVPLIMNMSAPNALFGGDGVVTHTFQLKDDSSVEKDTAVFNSVVKYSCATVPISGTLTGTNYKAASPHLSVKAGATDTVTLTMNALVGNTESGCNAYTVTSALSWVTSSAAGAGPFTITAKPTTAVKDGTHTGLITAK